MSALLRCVIDTNVIVSGLFGADSPPNWILNGWVARKFTLVITLNQLNELASVLAYPKIQERMRFTEKERNRFLARLAAASEVVSHVKTLVGATRDPKDDAILAAALASAADFLVSGDLDLLTLHPYGILPIVTPRRFCEHAGLVAFSYTGSSRLWE